MKLKNEKLKIQETKNMETKILKGCLLNFT